MDFEIYVAIDLRGGKVVRLRTGDPAQQTTYSSDPRDMAQHWLKQGARWLHVVNLDAAFGEGDDANRLALLEILAEARGSAAKVQYGGGMRSPERIAWALEQGAARVVLGTAAVQNPVLVQESLARWGAEHVAAGLDARNGKLSVRGWAEDTSLDAREVARSLADCGLHTLIYTDIARDGTGLGGNLAATAELAHASGLEVIASGGYRSLAEVRAARNAGLAGVVLGHALYEGLISLTDCLAVAQGG
jgi:phosphoribosylformimino-5-aminoimidazole carboxamide ribotide isomerase